MMLNGVAMRLLFGFSNAHSVELAQPVGIVARVGRPPVGRFQPRLVSVEIGRQVVVRVEVDVEVILAARAGGQGDGVVDGIALAGLQRLVLGVRRLAQERGVVCG